MTTSTKQHIIDFSNVIGDRFYNISNQQRVIYVAGYLLGKSYRCHKSWIDYLKQRGEDNLPLLTKEWFEKIKEELFDEFIKEEEPTN
jgi:hypothetical protein